MDETLLLEFGCVGQETTGPGGFAKALRTVPVVLELADETARRAAPGAWFVDFTNPVGIVAALLDHGHRAIGLCNSAIGFQRRFAALLGVAPGRVELEHVGLNHLTWERAARVDGTDRLGALLSATAPSWPPTWACRWRCWRTSGPSPDLPALLLCHRRGARRAAAYRGPSRWPRSSGAAGAVPRPGPRHQAGAAGAARRGLLQRGRGRPHRLLHAGTGDTQVVDVRNDGALPGLPDDVVVEVPARVDADGAHLAAPGPPRPRASLAWSSRPRRTSGWPWRRRSPRPGRARKALLTNPWSAPTGSPPPAGGAAGGQPALPRFFLERVRGAQGAKR